MAEVTVEKPIRVGVIGAGFIGPAHIESLRRLGFVEVTALAGSNQESAERKARDLSVPRAYGNYADLINDPEVDVVDICAPNQMHYPAAKLTLEAGKHVMCEKPLGMTSAESAELLALAERSGLAHAVTFNARYYPLLQHARSLIQNGELGDIYLISGGYLQDWLLHDTDYNWRVDASVGGKLRAVGDIGSHWLDLAQYLTGLSVTRLCADLCTFMPIRQKPERPIDAFASADVPRVPVNVDTDDAANILLRFGERARGTVQVSQVSAGRKNSLRIEINGSKGSIYWDGERANEIWIGRRDEPNQILIKDPSLLSPEAAAVARYPAGHDEGFPDSHTAVNRAFYTFIRAGGYSSGQTPTYPTFAAGHRENVLCDAILDSSERGAWVEVNV